MDLSFNLPQLWLLSSPLSVFVFVFALSALSGGKHVAQFVCWLNLK